MNKRRARLRPTRIGWRAVVFYAVILATFFAIPYSNLYFLSLAFLSVVLVLSASWSHGNLRGLQGELLPAAPAAAGSTTTVRLRVAAGRRHAQVRAAARVGDSVFDGPIGDLAAGTTTLSVEVGGLRRGLYRVTAWVESSFPHGTFRAELPVAGTEELIVHPQPLAAHGRSGPAAILAAAGVELRGGGSDASIAGLRDWRRGDEMRDVHWRATARRGALTVREWEENAGHGMTIVLDRRCTDRDAFEHALSVLATISRAAAETKSHLTLHTQSEVTTYGAKGKPFRALLRALAAFEALPADGPPPPPAPAGAVRLPARKEPR